MFKRIMSVMLAVVMLMAVAVVAVSAAEASDKLYVKDDNGNCYEVNKGDVVVYEYSLACDKKVCSLDCTTYFDAAGLKFVPEVDEYGDNTGAEFPNLVGPVYNFGLEGKILYNYSNVSGVRFPVNDTPVDKNVVFRGAFEVTAESGTYEIYTDLKVLGDNNNNKVVFDGVLVDETVTVLEAGSFPALTPVETPTEPQPTEPAPTETVPTEPAPTEPAPTEPATVEPTDAPTEAETTPAPATKDQSSTDDTKKPTNNAPVKTGTTAAAIAFITVVVMAAGVVMFSRKKISE